MNRAQQVRRVFAELRHVVGEQVSAYDLLRLAASIVEAAREPDDVSLEIGSNYYRGLHALPLDHAFSDGGWHVLYFEFQNGMPLPDEHEYIRQKHLPRIRRLLGSEYE